MSGLPTITGTILSPIIHVTGSGLPIRPTIIHPITQYSNLPNQDHSLYPQIG